MNIDYILIRLRLFLLSPIFPITIVLGTILFLVFIIYSSPVMLCDDNGWTLFNLKTELTSELAKYRMSIVSIEQYSDLQEQLKEISRPNFRNFDLEKYYASEYQNAIKEYNQSLIKINNLEISIKSIEPDFKLPITSNYYGRIGRGF